MKNIPIAIGLLIILNAAPSLAQIPFGGTPLGTGPNAIHLPPAPTAEFPPVDVAALLAEDEARIGSGVKGPYRYGLQQDADISTENDGRWTTRANGDRVWRTAIHCPGAYTIDFAFEHYVVPDGGMVFVYNEAGDVLGGFTAESAGGVEQMGVTQIAGDRITVEYQEPAGVSGQGHLMIGKVTHGYRDIFGLDRGIGDSGSCNNNVICSVGDPWRDQIRSVAMMTTFGGGFCTGQLVNNCDQDGTPYFLTARHCVLSGNPNTWSFRFNWQSPNCNNNNMVPSGNSVSGAQILVQNTSSDLALLELNSTPPASYDVFYSGWDKSGDTPDNTVAIHHPSGDVKKISFDEDPPGQAPFNAGSGTAQCWKIFDWEDGTTEGGSSGSGLWDQNGRLIGQLYGGQASCSFNFNDFYGRFDVSYPFIDQYLGNCGDELDGWPATVGIEEVMVNGQLSIFPNPGSGIFRIELPEIPSQVGTMRIMDATGRTAFVQRTSAGVQRIVVDLAELSDGIYFVETTVDQKRLSDRLVIRH